MFSLVPPTLHFLTFEASEDTDGVHTFDALASVSAAQRPALAAECEAARAWLLAALPQGPGPLEAGHTWDEAVSWQTETDTGNTGGTWHTLAWQVAGGEALAAAWPPTWQGDGTA